MLIFFRKNFSKFTLLTLKWEEGRGGGGGESEIERERERKIERGYYKEHRHTILRK